MPYDDKYQDTRGQKTRSQGRFSLLHVRRSEDTCTRVLRICRKNRTALPTATHSTLIAEYEITITQATCPEHTRSGDFCALLWSSAPCGAALPPLWTRAWEPRIPFDASKRQDGAVHRTATYRQRHRRRGEQRETWTTRPSSSVDFAGVERSASMTGGVLYAPVFPPGNRDMRRIEDSSISRVLASRRTNCNTMIALHEVHA
ncbi:hypothetical protein BD626DRAFT_181510 [Schizophyllum amplum]|uniref:Uncharacterized protein n=1 Tax=Schizophyllum amplum TaxID=97359 RepID=A0A550C1D9_9AGAR|nr:hypothetical protein BD626DRAFT_181510 [Auriculariopsis ampla]